MSDSLQLCEPQLPGLPVHHQLPESTQTHVQWVSDVIQPSNPLSSPSPPALNFPSIRVFLNDSALCIRWPKYWSFSFNISPSNEHPGLICFSTDWLDLLVIQGTLKSLVQHHSSKASILQHSAFFYSQLSYPYVTTGKTKALTRWTFVDKLMSLLFNMLSTCHNFPSKEYVSFNFMAAITICNDFGAPQNKVSHCFHCFPLIFAMK